MNNIVLQICEKFIGDVAEFFGAGSIKKIEEMEKTLEEKANSFILSMMTAYLEVLDNAILENKAARCNKGIVIERRNDKRELYTAFGQLKFSRTYFHDKRNREYVYLLDQAVGLENYERVSGTLAVNLVKHAQESSYGESSRHVTDGAVSRQTVMQKLRLVKDLQIEPSSEKQSVRILHVDADEDHVALQDGTNAIVPLICIYEGVKQTGKRGQCINPHYISSYGKKTEELWLEAVDWIYNSYDIDKIERIYLHGDGAWWIKEGLKWLPKSKMVLDKYHLHKSILSAAGRNTKARQEIYSALLNDDKKAFKQISKHLLEGAESEAHTKRIKNCLRYLRNNWAAITIYQQEACGRSCTEGHVSHVLSSRLSSRPMGWSKKGLGIMAELRAYCSSGGQISLKHLKQNKMKHKISKRISTKVARIFTGLSVENFNNVAILTRGKVIPMFSCLKGLQNGNGVL